MQKGKLVNKQFRRSGFQVSSISKSLVSKQIRKSKDNFFFLVHPVNFEELPMLVHLFSPPVELLLGFFCLNPLQI